MPPSAVTPEAKRLPTPRKTTSEFAAGDCVQQVRRQRCRQGFMPSFLLTNCNVKALRKSRSLG